MGNKYIAKTRQEILLQLVSKLLLSLVLYNITFEALYICTGPHKNGEDFSINLRVIQIMWKKLAKIPTCPVPIKRKKIEGNGRRRSKNKEDEVLQSEN